MPLSLEKSPRRISCPRGFFSPKRKDSNHGCTVTARANLKRAPELASPLLHSLEADFRVCTGAPFGHSPAMIFYFQTHLPCLPRNSDDGVAAAGVTMNVVRDSFKIPDDSVPPFPGRRPE